MNIAFGFRLQFLHAFFRSLKVEMNFAFVVYFLMQTQVAQERVLKDVQWNFLKFWDSFTNFTKFFHNFEILNGKHWIVIWLKKT